jgi:hypothetical protein
VNRRVQGIEFLSANITQDQGIIVVREARPVRVAKSRLPDGAGYAMNGCSESISDKTVYREMPIAWEGDTVVGQRGDRQNVYQPACTDSVPSRRPFQSAAATSTKSPSARPTAPRWGNALQIIERAKAAYFGKRNRLLYITPFLLCFRRMGGRFACPKTSTREGLER